MNKIDKWFISCICGLSAGGMAGAGLFGPIGAIVGAIVGVILVSIMLDRRNRE